MTDHKYRIFSGSALKCLAMFSMLIDHTASNLLAKNPIVIWRSGNYYLTLYRLMRDFGRLAFPIFAFLLAEGFLHTRSRKRYGTSLFLFALISEIPWNLEHTGTLHYEKENVFFTLFLGFLALCAIDRFRENIKLQILSLLALFIIALNLRADYGVAGFGLIVLMLVLREQPVIRALAGSCLLPSTWIGGLAFIPIAMYNGKRGFIRSPFLKYAFYAFYPLHILVLYYLKTRYFGQ